MLLSVNVGMPRDVPWQGRTVHTGAWKHPVAGPVLARRLNLDGDGQGDLEGHGGEQRAVLVYQRESYRHWHRELGLPEEFGQFGENLTVDGLADDEVCIGDRYRIGGAEFEVTQPRVTCYRVGMRLGVPQLAALLVAHHRPGFYMRVLREGLVQAGDAITRTHRGPLTVAETDALLYLPDRDLDRVRLAAGIPALSPGWRQSFADMLAPKAADTVAWEGFRPVRVTGVRTENRTVTSISLAGPPHTARPGQYITVRLPGNGTVRSYSLSSDACRITVKREPHGVASTFLAGLRPGSTLDVAAPRGDFVLEDGDGPVLLISAGIGLTPVLAMLHHLAGSPREVWWVHAARSPAEHPLAGEARALLATIPAAREHIFYSATTGRLTAARLADLKPPKDATAYVCGPDAFMTDMRTALEAAGVARIRTELFAARAAVNPGVTARPARPPHSMPGPGPTATFARSGVSASVPPATSILDMADACDVPTRWSCRTGVCHTCVTPLLAGEITYSPAPLEPPPAGQVLICCAHPSTDVVLDM